jgi:hypothetical protein
MHYSPAIGELFPFYLSPEKCQENRIQYLKSNIMNLVGQQPGYAIGMFDAI